MLDKIYEKLSESIVKLLDMVFKQGLLITILFAVSGLLLYDRYQTNIKTENRLANMEISMDTLRTQNTFLRYENQQCAYKVEKLTNAINDMINEPDVTKKKKIMERVKYNMITSTKIPKEFSKI